MLALFDFANPNSTSEQRMATNVPLQRLFFMNSDLVAQQARSLAARLKAEPDDAARSAKLTGCCWARTATGRRSNWASNFCRMRSDAWPQYAQVLLSSNEFGFVN